MGDTSITCGNCGTVNDPGASYCRECRALLAAYASPAGAGPAADPETAPPPATQPDPTTRLGVPPAAPPEDAPPTDPMPRPVPDDDGPVSAEPMPGPGAAADVPPPAAGTTPTLAGTLGSGAVGPVGGEPPRDEAPAVPADEVTPSERAPAAEPDVPPPVAEEGRFGRLDARVTGMEIEGIDPEPTTVPPAAPREPITAASDDPPATAWRVPPPSPSAVPPPIVPEAPTGFGGGAFGAGDRLATMTGATPRTILTVAGVLILASCVILAADLPGYLTLLSLCAGPVGFILLIVGAVMLLTQKPERRF